MLKLRRATVREAAVVEGSEQGLVIELAGGERRSAIADVSLVGACGAGDEVVVNVQARDLGLGSGGFDIVHVNLSKGLDGEGVPQAHVMKLNYSSLQHAVRPVEQAGGEREPRVAVGGPVAVLALHGQLAPLAWSFAKAAPGRRLGFVQTPGGALSGGHSRAVRALRAGGLLAGHITAGSAYGGELEAMTTAGALVHGFHALGWDAAVCGPGPGIVGSASTLGHGGMHALDSAHVALALGSPAVVLVARMSSADPRPRHRGVSHHTQTVLELLLAPVTVALPTGEIGLPGAGAFEHETAVASGNRLDRHEWRAAAVDLAGYEQSGLPATTMGRSLADDPLFFAAALAGGGVLGEH